MPVKSFFKCVLCCLLSLLVLALYFPKIAYADENIVPDAAFKQALLGIVDTNGDGAISKNEMHSLTSLTVEGNGKNIRSIEGLQYASNITFLNLINTEVSDISPVASLTRLTDLWLGNNEIKDIQPLYGLYRLKKLYLGNNHVKNLAPLSVLYTLEELELSNNGITDIGVLAELDNLTYLSLYQNKISNLTPLAGLKNLKALELGANEISDIRPLSGLCNLTSLMLWYNHIQDIGPLSALTNLATLILENNKISNIGILSSFQKLTQLNITSNPISDFSSIAGLRKLQYLWVSNTGFSDLTLLSNLSELKHLYMVHNNISRLEGIESLANLTSLDASANTISDIRPVAALKNLEQLHLEFNSIADISPLAGLSMLKHLFLSKNLISDVSPFTGMDQIEQLWLDDCWIQDIGPLKDLKGLKDLGLQKNIMDLGAGSAAMTVIHSLQDRGANVRYSEKELLVAFSLRGYYINALKTTYGKRISQPKSTLYGSFKVLGWYKEPSCINQWDFNVDTVKQDTTLYAKYTGVNRLKVKAVPNRSSYGTVKGGGTYLNGTQITVKAIPKDRYYFVKWMKGKKLFSREPVHTFEVDESLTLQAVFAPIGIPVLKASASGAGTVTLRWGKVTGAAGYQLYRSTSKNGKYTRVASLADTAFTDTGRSAGKKYYYKVRAYCTAGKVKTFGKYSGVKSVLVKHK